MKTNKLYKLIVPLLFLAGSIGVAWGQGNNDKDSYSNVTITHKETGGVWYDTTYQGTHSRNQGSGTDEDWLKDTFDEEGDTTIFDRTIQKTHEYKEVIYMFPGETRELILPDIMRSNTNSSEFYMSLYHYQRWYDYSTDRKSKYISEVSGDSYRNYCGYHFQNGLVGGTFLGDPGNDDARIRSGIYRVNFTMPTKAEEVYYIACDASNYTNVTKPSSNSGTMIEPTLSQRAIFEIRKASEIQNKLSTNVWFQDDIIHFPTKSIGKTDEQVALEMPARNYIVRGETNEKHSQDLSCRIIYPSNTNAFLNLAGASNGVATISGNTRKISFTYSSEPVDGAEVYIEVTKGEYRIARFTLIFDANTEALTQEKINSIIGESATDEEKALRFRTNEYMDANYTLLTKLDLDYTNVTTSDNSGYYPYPMDWNAGSYAFYTKASKAGVKHTAYPQWGEYAITNKFPFRDGTGVQPLPNSLYHLYVDANEFPGTVCTVPFRQDLCPGASLYVTYWMMSTANKGEQCDASVILVLKGIDKNGGETIIHRQASGQIPYNRDAKITSGTYSDAPLWNQLYFTFVNGATNTTYDHYELEIQSNNANTNGADFIIDDIRVYMQSPNARIEQQKLTCGESTRLRMDLTWEQLLRRLGLEETTESNTDHYIEFCFIDRDIYEAYTDAHPNNPDRYDDAVKAATIIMGRDQNITVGKLYYDLKYEENTQYKDYNIAQDDGGSYGSLASTNEKNTPDKYFFYKSTGDDGEKQLSVDFYADMSQGRPYTMLIRDNEDAPWGYPGERCAITTDFYVEGQNLIKMNGELIGPDNRDYCKGQIFKFDVDMRYYSEEEHDYVSYDTENLYYDWFFGSENAYNETSLAEALAELRKQDKEAIAEETVVNGETKYTLKTTAKLAPEQIAVIEKYLNINMVASENGLHQQLVLREKNLNIRIMEDGLRLVVTPIDTRVTEEDKALQLCFEPIPFTLTASSAAPRIQPGFEYMKYENDAYNPAMRIGLQQIKEASGTDAKEITVNLRNAKYALESYESGKEPDHIGLRWNTNENQKASNPIFLIDSDDPALDEIVHAPDFDRTRYIIGTVTELEATPYDNTMPDNSMKITFKYGEAMDDSDKDSPKFKPKEGYEYTFMVLIEEHNNSHENNNGACWGNFNLTMKVVPEYLVWQGKDDIKNWNNDANWKRALDDDIKASGKITDYDNDDRGYVPMLFSKVIMPKDSKVELYEAYFTGAMDMHRSMEWKTERPDYMESPSTSTSWNDGGHPILYDMMVYEDEEGNLSTKPYRVNLCDQIHFEPKAEMLHAELLDYNKAWVDYKLESRKWHTLASPLQGVVAGDFYTDGAVDGTTITDGVAGTENQEYFTPITFEADDEAGYNNANDNSRISPSVYQRGWKGETTMVSTDNKSNDVAVAGNWSAVYNDVTEAYDPGTGFSLKVLNMPKDVDDAVFRLPKADETFTYYDANGDETETKSEKIERKNAGKLKISTSDANTEDDVLFTVTNLEANGDYYLIGNPFMAYLKAQEFFNGNKDLASCYWYEEDGVQNIVAVADDKLISTSNATTNIPPLHSFFVKKKDNAGTDATVTFTADMQTLATETDGTNTSALILTAQTADGKVSRAAIAYDATAKTTYETSEDAELFLDSNLSDVPTIYTVAGTMATSINRTSELYNIPVGIYGNSTEMVTLSFDGLKNFSSATLYDAEKRTETPLREGTTITLPANTSGRYFLRAGAPTANEQIATDAIQIYTLSGNRVMVTSTAPLKDIRVYTISGALVKQAKGGFCSHELYLPEDGIYVISAKSANGAAQTAKVAVN